MKNWIKIMKKTQENGWKIPVLFQSHRPHNVDGTKLTGGGKEKSNNKNRKKNKSILS